MKKINFKVFIVSIACFIVITLAIGFVSIITSSQVLYSESKSKMLYLMDSKSRELLDITEPAEITVNNLNEFIKATFSMKKFNKEKKSYLNTYLNMLNPIVLNLTKSVPNTVSGYFTFDPKVATDGKYFMESWIIKTEDTYKLFDHNLVLNLYPLTKPTSAWFYTPMITKKPSWSNPYVDNDIHIPMISYTSPVFIEGKFIGVNGIDISLEKVEKIVSQMKIYKTGNIFLFDKKFNFIAGNSIYSKMKLPESKTKQIKKLIDDNRDKNLKFIEYYDDDIQKIMTYSYLDTGFNLVITVPKSEIMQQSINLQLLIGGVSLLGLILAIIFLLNI